MYVYVRRNLILNLGTFGTILVLIGFNCCVHPGRIYQIIIIQSWNVLYNMYTKYGSVYSRHFRSKSQSVHVLPANERTQLRWNANPYQLDWEGSSNEMDPSQWLMSYWLARWVELL